MMTMAQVRRSFIAASLGAPLEKDVTRRNGWKFLKKGDLLQACEKCQGLGPGGKLVRLGTIRVISARPECLGAMLPGLSVEQILPEPYGVTECRREGFPDMTPTEFVAFFCKGHKGVTPDSIITRIEFGYVV